MNRITINGKTVRCNGSNITIQNNNIIVESVKAQYRVIM